MLLVENVTIKDETVGFDLETFLPYQLNLAAEAAAREFQTVYKNQYGMLRTEWRVLFHLGQFGAMTAKQICERSNLHKTKISRAVAAMETKRFLTRTRLEKDRRHEMLSLTHSGQSVFGKLTKHAEAYQNGLSAKFSKQELAVLNKCLNELADK